MEGIRGRSSLRKFLRLSSAARVTPEYDTVPVLGVDPRDHPAWVVSGASSGRWVFQVCRAYHHTGTKAGSGHNHTSGIQAIASTKRRALHPSRRPKPLPTYLHSDTLQVAPGRPREHVHHTPALGLDSLLFLKLVLHTPIPHTIPSSTGRHQDSLTPACSCALPSSLSTANPLTWWYLLSRQWLSRSGWPSKAFKHSGQAKSGGRVARKLARANFLASASS